MHGAALVPKQQEGGSEEGAAWLSITRRSFFLTSCMVHFSLVSGSRCRDIAGSQDITDPILLLVAFLSAQPAPLTPGQKLLDALGGPQLIWLRRLKPQLTPRQQCSFSAITHPVADFPQHDDQSLHLLHPDPGHERQVLLAELPHDCGVVEGAQAAAAADEVGEELPGVSSGIGGTAGGRGQREAIGGGEDEVDEDALEGAEWPDCRRIDVPFVLRGRVSASEGRAGETKDVRAAGAT